MGVKRLIKRLLYRMFVAGQRFGVDLLPRHFYSEIPDIGKLRRSRAWRSAYSMTGIAGADPDRQLAFFRDAMGEPDEACRLGYAKACRENGAPGYGVAEAQLLFQFIKRHKPNLVLQIGAGVSTSLILQAADAAGHPVRIMCIDPFPTTFLRNASKAGRIDLIDRPVEDLSPDIARELQPGDLLFIDSTHTLGPAGEVTRLVLEWLPRLNVGVQVHFHDIMSPYDYMPDALDGSLFFPHETALLHAFLCLNPSFEILCSLAMLYHARRAEMTALLSGYEAPRSEDGLVVSPGSIPSSIFLRRVG